MPTPAEMMRLRLLAEAERRSPKGAFDVLRPNGDDSDHPLSWLTRPAKDGIAGTIHTAGTVVHGAAKAINYVNQDNTEDSSMPYPRRPASMQPRGGYDATDPDLDQTTGAPPDDGSAESAVAGIQAIVEGLAPDQQQEFLAQLRQWIEEQGGGSSEAPAMAGDSRARIAQDSALAHRRHLSFLEAYPTAGSIDRGQVPAWPRRFG